MPGNPESFEKIPPGLQQLAPPQARFCLSVARFVEKDLCVRLTGTRILVALSGGADSSALLLCLRYLSQKSHFSLCVAHLDHAIRDSSAYEAEWCRALCARLAIPFFSRRVDVAAMSGKEKAGLEENARNTRYAFFRAVAEAEGCDWTVTGHSKNDLAEDVLMRLLRGAGWPGLGGMPAVDPERRLLRPLLMSARREIESFLKPLGLVWLEDESNADPAYFRNRVRNILLPLMLEENPAFLDTAAGLWRLARIDEDFFEAIVPAAASCGEGGELPERTLFTRMADLRTLPQAVRLRLYKKNLARLGSGQALLDNLLRLDKSLENTLQGTAREGRSEHQFPGGKLAVVTRRGISWEKKQ